MYFIIPNILKTWCCILLLWIPSHGGGLMGQRDGNDNNKMNHVDSSGMKQGHWLIRKNGSLVEEGEYVNNVKERVWKAYYPNDTLKSEITFAGGKAKGDAKFYYEDGKLRECGNWQVDHWEGSYKYYYQSGELSYDWFYNDDGKREGKQTYFYANGKTMYQGQWDNGKTEGALMVYNDKGILVQEKMFANGQFAEIKEPAENPKSASAKFMGTGSHTIYNLNGQIEEKGFFVKGTLFDGQKFFYNEEGEQISTIAYKNGIKVDL